MLLYIHGGDELKNEVLNMRIESNLKKEITNAANEKNMTVSGLVTEAVCDYLIKEDENGASCKSRGSLDLQK